MQMIVRCSMSAVAQTVLLVHPGLLTVCDGIVWRELCSIQLIARKAALGRTRHQCLSNWVLASREGGLAANLKSIDCGACSVVPAYGDQQQLDLQVEEMQGITMFKAKHAMGTRRISDIP